MGNLAPPLPSKRGTVILGNSCSTYLPMSPRPAALRPFLKNRPPGSFQAPHQGIQDDNGAPQIDFIGMMGAAIAVMEDHGGFIGRHFTGQINYFLGGKARLLLGPLRSIRFHEFLLRPAIPGVGL